MRLIDAGGRHIQFEICRDSAGAKPQRRPLTNVD
jgi:hypothetical protein